MQDLHSLVLKHKHLAVLFIVLLGLALRLRGIGQAGFNEDEIAKVNAAHSYLHGQFAVNLEHPMLMKSLIAISLAAGDMWARTGGHPLAEEALVRLPNVLFGSLTAVVIFLIGQEFFGAGIGLLSAFLWSTGIIAITINRVAKEDTLLVCFTWLAYYCYARAKNLVSRDENSGRLYAASGASFGLMLASKYFPHYLGLNALYYWFRGRRRSPTTALKRCANGRFLGACALIFILFNPLPLMPGTLRYILGYIHGSSITHHGYLVMGRLYREDAAGMGGMPKYFYLLLLAIKTPISILAGFLVGLAVIWKRRREPGPSFVLFMLLWWIVPFSLVGPKWFRYMLAWMPTVYIVAAVGLAYVGSALMAWARQRWNSWTVPALAAACGLLLLVYPAAVAVESGPYYSLYLNAFGLNRIGHYFPHDEMNDMGLRPAIERICETAPYGASVGGEAKPVFDYYFHRYGRDDLKYFDLSDKLRRVGSDSAFLVVQEGRRYFENIDFVQSVESHQAPIHTVRIDGANAADIYHNEQLAVLRTGQ
jgi:4-amino-4-deoxy-L-arabinose transferase-like glycosyltransferase